MSRIALLAPLILLVCVCGCGSIVLNDLGELGQLRNELIKEFHEPEISVSLNDSTNLAVTFVNSQLNTAPSDERLMRAQETALFIKRRYSGINGIKTMLVKFIRKETRTFVVDYTEQVDSFVFWQNGVLVGAPAGDDPQAFFKGEDDVSVTYNAARNESEVRVVRMQLEGDMEQGVALSPHFKVRGDATTAGHAIGIPAAIIFNFSSFAPVKVFKSDPPLKIVADGVVIFSDKAHNQSATAEGGNEFLVQAIPLEQFLKLSEARAVVLGLGSKEYLLSAKQLRTLREMADYANAARAGEK